MTARTNRHRLILLAVGAVGLSMLSAACSGKAGSDATSSTAQPSAAGSAAGSAAATTAPAAYEMSATTPAPSGDIDAFSWALYAEPPSLDYAYAFDYPNNTVLSNVCESLLRWNADLTISPGLAEKVDNPTPTTWVYTIRKGVTFHDGSTMTADDVVASLSRHLDPEVGSYWSSVFRRVKSIEKTGPDQVTVTLTEPDSMFNQYMAVSPGTIESAKTLAADGKDYGNPTKGVNCTGPFAFSSWAAGQSITLKRYDNYWDTSLKAKAGEVTFVMLQDANTRTNALASGQVDGGWAIPANAYAQLESGGPGKLYFGINTTVNSEIVGSLTGALKDKRVRQALEMAIDRAGLVKTAEQGVAEISNSLVTKNTWLGVSPADVDAMYAALPQYPYDVAKAKALVAEAGATGQKVVIGTTNAGDNFTITAAAVADAAKAIGLDPTIQTISADKYTALFSDPAARAGIDLFETSWYTSLADPEEMYGVLATGEFSNYGGWSNPAFDAANAVTIKTPLGVERTASMVTQQQIAADDLPWLPLYSSPTSLWLGSRITGVVPSIYYMYFPWAASIGAA